MRAAIPSFDTVDLCALLREVNRLGAPAARATPAISRDHQPAADLSERNGIAVYELDGLDGLDGRFCGLWSTAGHWTDRTDGHPHLFCEGEGREFESRHPGWSGDLNGVLESLRYDLGKRHDEVTVQRDGDAAERVEPVAGAAAFFES